MTPSLPVISIIGTTGVGKSQLSIELASRFNGEIINADSMQMYRGLDVITNKHPHNERAGIRHHVMDHVPWDEEYDMHRFQRDALAAISDIHQRGKLPILVGGTHYYLQSVLFTNKTVVTNSATETLGAKQEDMVKGLTPEQEKVLNGPDDDLITHLRDVDPQMANKFHPNDHRRIRRSLEIYYKTGERASDIYKSQREHHTESALRFKTLFLWVWSDPEALQRRLDSRVDNMLASGGMDEIKALYKHYKSLASEPDCERGVWQVIGFKEFLPWLRGLQPLEPGVEDMKVRTRRYAKRQVKWIRNTLCPSLLIELPPDDNNVFLLDASDLSQWALNVNARGTAITQAFLSDVAVENIERTPKGLEDMIPTTRVEKPTAKHHVCDTCKDAAGQPLIVLAGQWTAHLQGSKHRSMLKRGKRKRDYEEYLKSKEAKNL